MFGAIRISALLMLLDVLCHGFSTIAAESQPRLAIISNDPKAAAAVDLLTVEMSRRKEVALLERAQIETVVREQKLSAAGMTATEALKLGQFLGADGLIILNLNPVGSNVQLFAQLTAVKPGVAVAGFSMPWPMADSGWPGRLGEHFAPYFGKLGVLKRDAVPLSILNLRAATKTDASTKLERELTVLLFNRLLRERELFVLERRSLDAAALEKELNRLSEAPFWNGSYLLEGTIDKNGYSPDKMTVSVKLSPPQGGTAVDIEVEGPRSNQLSLIEDLTRKIMTAIKPGSAATAWDPQAEAARYFDEAVWALKWGAVSEAQSAVESSWALGKRDLECATLRVRSYLAAAAPDTGGYTEGTLNAAPMRVEYLDEIKESAKEAHGLGLVFSPVAPDIPEVNYTWVNKPPNPDKIRTASHMLGIYSDFSQTLPPSSLKQNSPWCRLGIEILRMSAEVLQHSHFVPASIPPVADDLAELRRRARSIADWIARIPAVHDNYWLGDRVAERDEFQQTLQQDENIFNCMLRFGSFWQERPEDCVALYRELMRSPAFSYIHSRLWFRELAQPLLTAWNPGDRSRVPGLWQNFTNDLVTSSNALFEIEGRILVLVNAGSDRAIEAAGDAVYAAIFSNAPVLLTNNAEVTYIQNASPGFIWTGRSGMVRQGRERLGQRFQKEYQPRIAALDREYWAQAEPRIAEQQSLAIFAAQKRLLTDGKLHDGFEFIRVFRDPRFHQSRKFALEIEPLLQAYRSNLVAQTNGKTGREYASLHQGIMQVDSVQPLIQQALSSPPSPLPASTARITPQPAPVTMPTPISPLTATNPVQKPVAQPAPPPANLLTVRRFHKVPEEIDDSTPFSGFMSGGRMVDEDRIWFYIRHPRTWYDYVTFLVAWSAKSGRWDVISDPYGEEKDDLLPNGGRRSHPNATLTKWEGDLYIGQWHSIKRFNTALSKWEKLDLPAPGDIRLFVVNKKFYGASEESLFEITEHGRSAIVLASNRRRPPVTSLDSAESFGQPVLFPGPDGSLRVALVGRVCTWDGKEWNPVRTPGFDTFDLVDQDIFLRRTPHASPPELWWLPSGNAKPDLVWTEAWRDPFGAPPPPELRRQRNVPLGKARWTFTNDLSLANAAFSKYGSALLFLIPNYPNHRIPNTRFVPVEFEGRHANFVLLDLAFKEPLVIPVKFDLEHGEYPFDASGRTIVDPLGTRPWLGMLKDELVIGHPETHGLWIVPRAELDAALDRERARMRKEAAPPTDKN